MANRPPAKRIVRTYLLSICIFLHSMVLTSQERRRRQQGRRLLLLLTLAARGWPECR